MNEETKNKKDSIKEDIETHNSNLSPTNGVVTTPTTALAYLYSSPVFLEEDLCIGKKIFEAIKD